MKIQLKCKACGKEFSTYESRKDSRKYCSFECSAEGRRTSLDVRCKYCNKLFRQNGDHKIFCSRDCYAKHKKEKAERIFICVYCGKEATANNHKNYYRYHNGKKEVRKFCSKECADLARTKPRETRICLNCGKEFKVLPMPSRAGSDLLCSKKCQYEYYSGDKAFRWDGGRVEVKCANCNKTMFMARSRYDRSKEHFCSPGCYGEYYSGMSLLERYGEEKAKKISQKLSESLAGDKHYNWQDGKSFEPYGIEFNDKLKKKIRKRDNYACQICGVAENGKSLSVHHIDYDKQNNKPENLTALCMSCHTKTNFNRQCWQSYFASKFNYLMEVGYEISYQKIKAC